MFYKFRTLSVLENGAVVNQVKRDDDRVTRIGRVLRHKKVRPVESLIKGGQQEAA